MASARVDSKEYIGQSGRHYSIKQILQEESYPSRCVCLATPVTLDPLTLAGEQKFVLKHIHEVNFKDLQDINDMLQRGGASNVYLVEDTIPEESMFVFQYFADHLLRFVQKNLPLALTKRILKDALRGVTELHDQDIVHTDIKADNVLIDWKVEQDGIIIGRVQLGDLEDAAHIPPGSHMVGKQANNMMWRSPEAHARGPVDKPSDIFSFALVCIYAVHKRVIFAIGEEELDEGVEPLAVVIERQMSYFADEDELSRFIQYLGDNPWIPVFEVTRDGFNKDNPRKPFALWQGVDEDFKNLICAMTNFDPGKRITAREALAHTWFEGV
ncbi:MAG: hypothetical protein Q9165_006699 [Trypethelium subeluteriae]